MPQRAAPVTDSDIISRVIEREGGYVNRPEDQGGCTKLGITIGTLADWRKQPVTCDDILRLSVTEARDILLEKYIEEPGFGLLESDILKATLVDFYVNSGHNAVKALQRCLGVIADGIFGQETAKAANAADGRKLAVRLNGQRLRLFGEIVAHDATQAVFAQGWANRIAEQFESLA